MLPELIIILLLFILWAFFAGTETAFVSVNRFKLNNLKKRGKGSANIAYYLIKKPERLLSTTLIGTNISLILAANITSIIFNKLYKEPKPISSVIAITLFSLIVCEIIPKNIAIKNSLKVTLLSSIPIYIFYIIFFPVGKIFSFLSKVVIRLFGIPYSGIIPKSFTKKDDVKIFLTSSLEDKFTKDERRYFVDSLDFGQKKLNDVMIPLIDIYALTSNDSVNKCYNFISKNKKSYIPIYKERIDNIIGVIYANDLFASDKNLSISNIMREPYFVPESKNINELYRELYIKDIPVVFAVDEYGGVTGIATIYDIGEEVIGNIGGVDKKSLIVKIQNGEYLCDGDVEINEINNLLSTNIITVDFTTINGMIVKNLGKIPKKGEYFETHGYRFIVEKSNKKRSEIVKIKKLNMDLPQN